MLVARTPRLGLNSSLVASGAGLAMLVMRVGDRNGLGVDSATRRIADVLALLTMAAVVHVVLSLPDGVLKTKGRQLGVAAWYGVAIALCIYYVAGAKALTPWPLALGWCVAVGSALPALRGRYVDASAHSRQLIQSLVAGSALALTFIVILVTLHSLVDWPLHVGAPLIAFSCLVPLGLAAGASNAASHADRILVHLITALGTVAIVAGAYLLAVRGFDKAPDDARRPGPPLVGNGRGRRCRGRAVGPPRPVLAHRHRASPTARARLPTRSFAPSAPA